MYTAVLDDKPLELKKELAKELSSGIRRLEDVRTPFLHIQNGKAYLHTQLAKHTSLKTRMYIKPPFLTGNLTLLMETYMFVYLL